MIRPAGPGDLRAVAELHARYREELAAAGVPYPGGRAADEVWTGWIGRRLSAGDVRVALDHGRPVGYVVWEVRHGRSVASSPTAGPAARVLTVVELYVAAEQRGRTFGTGLVVRAIDRGRDDGVEALEVQPGVDNEASRALFERFGFERVGGVLRRPLASL